MAKQTMMTSLNESFEINQIENFLQLKKYKAIGFYQAPTIALCEGIRNQKHFR